jgi:two-component system sensor kinase FixL
MPSSELQAIMDAAVDGIVLIDQRGVLTAFNRSAERLFGYEAAEAVGRDVSILMPEPYRSRHSQYLERYLSTGVAHIIGIGREVEGMRRDGSVFPLHLSVGRIAGTGPARFVGILRDITGEQQARLKLQGERDRATAGASAEQEARLTQERLMQISRMATLGEMAAGMAHELNQPLSAITTYAQACQRLISGSNPDLEESRLALKEIAQEALRAGDIIRRLRSVVSRQENARTAVDLNALIEDLMPLLQSDAHLHGIRIELKLAEVLSEVDGDVSQLQQMVLNLVRNSIDALASHGEQDRQITMRTAAPDSATAELSVCDNGPGVPDAVASRLFIPFTTTKPGGTGLGLSISHTIARTHGGSVSYQPLKPHGACFFVRLPCREPIP